MGWLDTLWRRRLDLPRGAPPVLAFDTPHTRERHEMLARELASLGALPLSIDTIAREDGVTVILRIAGRRRAVSHPRHAIDLGRMLRALDSLLPDGCERRFCAIARADLRRDHAVAFANAREVKLLRDDEWQILSEDPPSAQGTSIVEGLKVRGTAERWPDGALKQVELAEEASVAGLRCAAGSTIRFADGFLLEATLAVPFALTDCTLPPGTRVYFHYRSRAIGLGKLDRSLVVAGLVLPSGTELELDHHARLVAAVLGEATAPLGGYRDGALLPASTRILFRDGRWIHDPAPAPER